MVSELFGILPLKVCGFIGGWDQKYWGNDFCQLGEKNRLGVLDLSFLARYTLEMVFWHRFCWCTTITFIPGFEAEGEETRSWNCLRPWNEARQRKFHSYNGRRLIPSREFKIDLFSFSNQALRTWLY